MTFIFKNCTYFAFSFLARLISTISTYYTYSASVSGAIYEGGKYKEIESDSDFNDEDCGAYCYLDISTPCRAYATIATKCHLLNLESGTSDIIDTQVIKYNSGKEPFKYYVIKKVKWMG